MANKFVSTTGNNSNPGTQDSPYRDWWKGIDNVFSDDTLYARGGVYDESIVLTGKSGSSGAPITIKAYPGETVTLAPSVAAGNVLRLINCAYLQWQNFVIDAIGTAGINDGAGIALSDPVSYCVFDTLEVKRANYSGLNTGNGCHHNQYLNLHSHDNAQGDILFQGHGLYLAGYDNLVDGGSYHDNQGFLGTSYGVHQYHGAGGSHRNTIRRLSSYNNNIGVILSSGNDNRGENLLIYNNDAWGAQFYNAGTNLKLFNCTIAGNGSDAVRCESASGEARNNIFYGNANDAVNVISGSVTQSNNFTSDPWFVDPASADYRLRQGSPAISQAMDLSAYFTTDILGNTRG